MTTLILDLLLVCGFAAFSWLRVSTLPLRTPLRHTGPLIIFTGLVATCRISFDGDIDIDLRFSVGAV